MVGYGTNGIDLLQTVASYVDRILRGAKINELPVQFPTSGGQPQDRQSDRPHHPRGIPAACRRGD
jgi:hypothetical protein